MNIQYKGKKASFATREFTADSLIIGEVWDEGKNYYLSNTILPMLKNAVVLDIGAHIGSFSVLASVMGAQKVYAYEPEKDNFTLLVENTQQYKTIYPFNYAVGSHSRKGLLSARKYVSPVENVDTLSTREKYDVLCNTGGGRIIYNKENVPDNCTVEDINIMDVNTVLKDTTFIKMDCEGCEFEIIPAIKDFSNISAIVMEYHSNDKQGKELGDILSSKGFNVEITAFGGSLGFIRAYK